MRELQSQAVQEAGQDAPDYSDLQVLLTSSKDFGPGSIRKLTVRRLPHWFIFQGSGL